MIVVSFTASPPQAIEIINADTGLPFADDPRPIIGYDECDLGCCSLPIYSEDRP